MEIKITGVNK